MPKRPDPPSDTEGVVVPECKGTVHTSLEGSVPAVRKTDGAGQKKRSTSG